MKNRSHPELDFSGRSAKDAGISLVLSHTPTSYMDSVVETIRSMPSGLIFTSEDVRDSCGDPPNHINAIGASINRCIKFGLMKRVGFQKAERTKAHARIIAIYEKL
jgi:hypothetical protein